MGTIKIHVTIIHYSLIEVSFFFLPFSLHGDGSSGRNLCDCIRAARFDELPALPDDVACAWLESPTHFRFRFGKLLMLFCPGLRGEK